ncbi:SDR family NAD(P)-dependent oxidoreductase [Catalinimonas niigatensis]|uniref:SDR family NAD(P)-dependent oxidoreductase n=1 Tax=Catalinimonas niigatensis TaxID=1397264 RepID=UPI002666DBC6|nr:SDR family NAD(P)-dependent oxidoreductase [Catalinimonas niigatensis]WPP50402.1 SDR family NAD(P)-dependent oxidoreductase [Catalinimonas niigatensis]
MQALTLELPARRLTNEGVRVVLISRTREELEEVAGEIGENKAQVVEADVAQEDHIKKAYKQVIRQWGRVDIVVANAGVNGVCALHR